MKPLARKRAWELGASAALLLALVVAVGGFFAWRERQRRLDRELAFEIWKYALTLGGGDHAERGAVPRMLSLLRQGANVRLRGREPDWTVLTVAVYADDQPLLREALSRGADANDHLWSPSGRSLLMQAAAQGSVESVALLLAHGADVNWFPIPGERMTALDLAQWRAQWADEHETRARYAAIIRLLKQHGPKE